MKPHLCAINSALMNYSVNHLMSHATNSPRLIIGVFALLFATATPTILAADFERFTGGYSGSAQIESDGKTSQRDMSVVIKKEGDGFQVNWKSISRKADGRVKEKEYTIGFLPTQRDGIYSSAMGVNLFGNPVPLDPMKGDPYVWGRIIGDTLTVFSLLIDKDGGYEMQEYNRTLADGGLNLEYQRIRNGAKLKSINVFLEKK